MAATEIITCIIKKLIEAALLALKNSSAKGEMEKEVLALSQDLLEKNVELHTSIKSSKVNCTKYLNALLLFQTKLKGVFEFISDKVLTENGNVAGRRSVIEKLLTKLKNSEEKLGKLVEAIYDDAAKESNPQTWLFSLCIPVAVFAISCCLGNTTGIVLAVGVAGVFGCRYVNDRNTSCSSELNELADKVESFRRKVAKYRTDMKMSLLGEELSQSKRAEE